MRGCEKRIYHIKNTESMYFEEAVFVPTAEEEPETAPNTFDVSFFIALIAVTALLGVTFTRKKA